MRAVTHTVRFSYVVQETRSTQIVWNAFIRQTMAEASAVLTAFDLIGVDVRPLMRAHTNGNLYIKIREALREYLHHKNCANVEDSVKYIIRKVKRRPFFTANDGLIELDGEIFGSGRYKPYGLRHDLVPHAISSSPTRALRGRVSEGWSATWPPTFCNVSPTLPSVFSGWPRPIVRLWVSSGGSFDDYA